MTDNIVVYKNSLPSKLEGYYMSNSYYKIGKDIYFVFNKLYKVEDKDNLHNSIVCSSKCDKRLYFPKASRGKSIKILGYKDTVDKYGHPEDQVIFKILDHEPQPEVIKESRREVDFEDIRPSKLNKGVCCKFVIYNIHYTVGGKEVDFIEGDYSVEVPLKIGTCPEKKTSLSDLGSYAEDSGIYGWDLD